MVLCKNSNKHLIILTYPFRNNFHLTKNNNPCARTRPILDSHTSRTCTGTALNSYYNKNSDSDTRIYNTSYSDTPWDSIYNLGVCVHKRSDSSHAGTLSSRTSTTREVPTPRLNAFCVHENLKPPVVTRNPLDV